MSSHISEDKSWLNFNQRWKKIGCKKTHSVWTVGEIFMHACSYVLYRYICIYARGTFHFIILIKCYLLSWQVSEAGFPVTGVAHMQWVATSKMSIREDKGEAKRK